MAHSEFGHWPTTMHSVLEAAQGLTVATHSMRPGPPSRHGSFFASRGIDRRRGM